MTVNNSSTLFPHHKTESLIILRDSVSVRCQFRIFIQVYPYIFVITEFCNNKKDEEPPLKFQRFPPDLTAPYPIKIIEYSLASRIRKRSRIVFPAYPEKSLPSAKYTALSVESP